jgi:signal transduction histidine kinase/CheY-like chemotaxis protein
VPISSLDADIDALASTLVAKKFSWRTLAPAALAMVACIVALNSVVGWQIAGIWSLALLGLRELCRRLAGRVRDAVASKFVRPLLAAAHGLYMLCFGALAAPLWLHPSADGPLVGTLFLAIALTLAVFDCRGSRMAVVGAAPQVLMFVVAPLFAVWAGHASLPPPAYWLGAVLLGAASIIGGRELAKMDAAVGEALGVAEERRLVAESATAAKSAFVAMVSHELRTPINGILAAAADLQAAQLGEFVSVRADLIAGAGAFQRTLLNDLLDLAKLEAGRMTVERIPLDLDSLITQTAQLYEGEAGKKGLELCVMRSGLPERPVLGDPTRLRQILNNLLSNAIKFTPGGVVSLTVVCSSSGQPDGKIDVAVAVKDTGPGLSPERVAKLFRPFEQTDSAVARTHGGTGLGLSISRQLAELMGGTIAVESAEDAGAEFTLRLPLLLATAQAAEPPAEVEPVELNCAGLRVLVADDHEINRRVLSLLLSPLGIDAQFAFDGEEASSRLVSEPFDIVVMDVHMPKLDGRDVTRRLRSRAGPNRDVPVIAVTGSGSPEEVESCRRAGMDAHVLKPVDARDLHRAISEALATAKAPRATSGSPAMSA